MRPHLSPSTTTTVKHIETFLKLIQPEMSLEPRAYKVCLITLFFNCFNGCKQVPLQRGVDCGVHTMHNIKVAAQVSFSVISDPPILCYT